MMIVVYSKERLELEITNALSSHPKLKAAEKMQKINDALDMHGVETIRKEPGWKLTEDRIQWEWLLYCNTGETYQDTACYDLIKGEFFVGSWGDWYEENTEAITDPWEIISDCDATITTLDDIKFVIIESWDQHDLIEGLMDNTSTTLDDLCEWGFSDEYDTCSECLKAIKTSPDRYGWQTDFWLPNDGSDIVCGKCVRDGWQEEYLEDMTNNPRKYVNEDLVDLEKHGFFKLDFEFQNGLHIGQNDSPKRVLRAILTVHPQAEGVFTASNGQFDVTFWPWIGAMDTQGETLLIDFKTLDRFFERGDGKMDYDPGTETAKLLRGETSDHLATKTRELTAEEFISGNWGKDNG